MIFRLPDFRCPSSNKMPYNLVVFIRKVWEKTSKIILFHYTLLKNIFTTMLLFDCKTKLKKKHVIKNIRK